MLLNAPLAADQEEEKYRIIRVPSYLTGVNLDEVTGLVREGAGSLYGHLLPYQVKTVHGMFYQAANRFTKGCILADQTGLGKLVQSIVVAAALEAYLSKTVRNADYSGVLFIFPASIYDAQVAAMHE